LSKIKKTKRKAKKMSSLTEDDFLKFAKADKLSKDKIIKEDVKRVELGKGSFGKVFSFDSQSVKVNVAFKQTSPSEIREYVITKYIVAALKEYNIDPSFVNISAIKNFLYHESDGLFLVSARQEKTLETLKVGKLPTFDWYNIFYQLAKVLYLCERAGIMHLDVKPANVLVDKQNNLFLSDFGMYNIIPLQNETKYYRLPFDVQTYNYRAPELFLAHDEPIKSAIQKPFTCSIVWSLGMTMLELAVPELFHGVVNYLNDTSSDFMLYYYLFLSTTNHDLEIRNSKFQVFADLEADLHFADRFLVFVAMIQWRKEEAKTNQTYISFTDYIHQKKLIKYIQDTKKFEVFTKWCSINSVAFTSHVVELWMRKYGTIEDLIQDIIFDANSSTEMTKDKKQEKEEKENRNAFSKKIRGVKFPDELSTYPGVDHSLQYWIEQCLIFNVNERIELSTLLNSPIFLRHFTKLDQKSWGTLWSDKTSSLLPFSSFNFTSSSSSFSFSSSSSSSAQNEAKNVESIFKANMKLYDRMAREYLHIWTLYPDMDSTSQKIRNFYMQFLFMFQGQIEVALCLIETWFPGHAQTRFVSTVWKSALGHSSDPLRQQNFIYLLNCLVVKNCWRNDLMNFFTPRYLYDWMNIHGVVISKEEYQKSSFSKVKNYPFTSRYYAAALDKKQKSTNNKNDLLLISLNKVTGQTLYHMSKDYYQENQLPAQSLAFPTSIQENLTVATQMDIVILNHIMASKDQEKEIKIEKESELITMMDSFNNDPETFWSKTIQIQKPSSASPTSSSPPDSPTSSTFSSPTSPLSLPVK
jgi:serine/threonine protein kinase